MAIGTSLGLLETTIVHRIQIEVVNNKAALNKYLITNKSANILLNLEAYSYYLYGELLDILNKVELQSC